MAMTKNKFIVVLIFTVILFPVNMFGEINNIKSCKEIKDDMQRLSCFDSFFNEDNDSKSQQDITIDKSNDISKTKSEAKQKERLAVNKSNFGLLKNQDQYKNKEVLYTKIDKTKKIKNNKIIFTMENGQVWLAESSYRARNFFRPATKISIEQAPISGYQMTALDKNQKIRIKRIK